MSQLGPAASSRGVRATRVVGEILVTLGAVLVLFVAYELWWTNVVAQRTAGDAADELRQTWGNSAPTDSGTDTPTPTRGEAFALMYIPRLSSQVWGLPVVQGVGPAQLARGVGHYPRSAWPGQLGNFAVAAHRATNGEPFRDFDRLRAGDLVYVETDRDWFVYRLSADRIVAPSDVWVIEPVPNDPATTTSSDETPTQSLITLTTCNPRWSSEQRWVWWGTLVEQLSKADGGRPAGLEDRS